MYAMKGHKHVGLCPCGLFGRCRTRGHFAKVVEMIYKDCDKECEKWPKVAECKACGESCKACTEECTKAAA